MSKLILHDLEIFSFNTYIIKISYVNEKMWFAKQEKLLRPNYHLSFYRGQYFQGIDWREDKNQKTNTEHV